MFFRRSAMAGADKSKQAAKAETVVQASGKAVNVGPARGNNSFPVSNKGRANTSSRGGGGAAGDGAGLVARNAAKAAKSAD
jgi:hypothetical protein